MVEIEDPITGATLDFWNPVDSAKSIGLGVGGAALGIAVLKGGQFVYNQLAQETPDEMGPVEAF